MVSPVASCASPLTVIVTAVKVTAKVVTGHAVDYQMLAAHSRADIPLAVAVFNCNIMLRGGTDFIIQTFEILFR